MTWVRGDILAAWAMVALYFTSGSQSVSSSCDSLVRPVDGLDPRHLEGRWAVVAGSLNHPPSLEALKLRDSITINYSKSNRTMADGYSSYTYTQINRFGDRCQYLPYNISVQESNFTFNAGGRFNLTGVFLHTSCPDCLVMRWDVESRRRLSTDLYLVSRRREVGSEEMKEYTAQLECLGLPPPVVMKPTMTLCPE